MSEPHAATGIGPLGVTPPGARRAKPIVMGCAHGATSALLLAGDKGVSDLTLLDILLARHYAAHECRCAPDPRLVPVSPARA